MKKKRKLLLVGVLITTIVAILIFLIRTEFFKEEFVISNKYQEYSDDNFYFKYPQSAEVIKFDDEGQRLGTIRINVTDEISIDLEHKIGSTESAFEEVKQSYEYADNHKYNQSPKKIPNDNIQGYYATRFLQNVEFNLLSDYAVFDTPKGLFQLEMDLINEDQKLYTQGHKDFFLILKTLEVKFK